MSHDRCYDHKCRACTKCAEAEHGCPRHPAWSGSPDDCAFCRHDTEALRREVERLHVVVDQEARARQAAEALADRERKAAAHYREKFIAAHSEADQEAMRAHVAESEVARLKSYIAAGVGGAS